MIRLSKNTDGFGVLEFLFVMVLIGFVVFAGYYMLQVRSDEKSSDPNTENDDSITAQYSERYENEELGLTFSYPEEWGEATVEDSSFSEDNQSGERTIYTKSVTFSDNSTLKVHVPSTENTSIIRGGVFSPAKAFIDWCENESDIGAVSRATDSCRTFESEKATEREKFTVIDKSKVDADPPALLFTSYEWGFADDTRKPLTVLLVRTRSEGEFRTAHFVLEGVEDSQKQELLDLYSTIEIFP